MLNSSAATGRRTVHYATLDEIVADAERIADAPYRTVGQWHYGQILNHLAAAIDGVYDGFGCQAPWPVRTLVAPLLKNRFLHKPMPAGFRLPKKAAFLLPPPTATVDEELEHLRRAITRLKTETPTAPHPIFGLMTQEEATLLNLRHCELHMSFVVPEGGEGNTDRH